MKSKIIEITEQEYIELLRCEALLRALEHSGVDNWEWYGEAIDLYEKYLEDLNLPIIEENESN